MTTPETSLLELEDADESFVPNGNTGSERPSRESTKPTPLRYRKGMFTKPALKVYAQIGSIVYANDKACGEAILKQAEACAESLDGLADKYPQVRRALMATQKHSALAEFAVAHGTVLHVVLYHHSAKYKKMLHAWIEGFTGMVIGPTEDE